MWGHKDSRIKKDGEVTTRHTTLKFNPDASVHNFRYVANVQSETICHLIASNDLPLSYYESGGFTYGSYS